MTSKNPEFMREAVQRWLGAARMNYLKAEELQGAIDDLSFMMTGLKAMSYDSVSVSASSDPHKLDDQQHKIDDMRNSLSERIAHMMEDTLYLTDLVGLLQPPGLYVYLHEYRGYSWPRAAVKVGFSERDGYRKSEEGYTELYGYMPEIWKREVFPGAI